MEVEQDCIPNFSFFQAVAMLDHRKAAGRREQAEGQQESGQGAEHLVHGDSSRVNAKPYLADRISASS